MAFEITVDGNGHPGTFATQAEADQAAAAFRAQNPGKEIGTRVKTGIGPEGVPQDGLGTVQNVDPSKVLVQRDGRIFEQSADEAAAVHQGAPKPIDAQQTAAVTKEGADIKVEPAKLAADSNDPAPARTTTNVPPPFKR